MKDLRDPEGWRLNAHGRQQHGLTDNSQVDTLGVRRESVNLLGLTKLLLPNRLTQPLSRKAGNSAGRRRPALSPYTLHPTPYTLHPAPHTPYTQHLPPYTPYLTPYQATARVGDAQAEGMQGGGERIPLWSGRRGGDVPNLYWRSVRTPKPLGIQPREEHLLI